MLINSWGYIIIFVVTAALLHWLLPHKARKYFICIFNLLFYSMWKWEYSLLLVFTSSLIFYAGLQFDKTSSNKRRLFNLTLIITIGILVFFKYSRHLVNGYESILDIIGIEHIKINTGFILPLGISFYTFQSLSYLFDVYRKEIKPTKNYFDFFSYSTFWPTIIAGPILKASETFEQFISKRTINLNDLSYGTERIITGLFKKVVLADNISSYVNYAFTMNPVEYSSFDVWVMTFLFGFQLYFDFSGYSDIAIGTAQLMGFKIKENFNWPYFSYSPQNFWNRWHISLYNWLRSYIYSPLSISLRRFSTLGISFSVMATFFICGVWHGSTWNFVIWGLFHGCLLLLFSVFKPIARLTKKLPFVSWAMTYVLISLAWIPFRSENLQQCFILCKKIFTISYYHIEYQKLPAIGYYSLILLFLSMCALYLFKYLRTKFESIFAKFDFIKIPVFAVMVFLIIIYLNPSNQFLYLQF